MDCSWGEGNNACDGGEDFRAYQFIMKNGGITTEEQYGPYLGQVRILIKVAALEMNIRIYMSKSNSWNEHYNLRPNQILEFIFI